MPVDDLRRLLTMFMDEVYEDVTCAAELNIKKLCERLSWIGPDWLTSNDHHSWIAAAV